MAIDLDNDDRRAASLRFAYAETLTVEQRQRFKNVWDEEGILVRSYVWEDYRYLCNNDINRYINRYGQNPKTVWSAIGKTLQDIARGEAFCREQAKQATVARLKRDYLDAFESWRKQPEKQRKDILPRMRGPRYARRTDEQLNVIRGALLSAAEAEQPVSCRRLFYVLVGWRLIRKIENDYQNVVIEHLGKMREGGIMPWSWIADYGRRRHKPRTVSSLQETLRYAQAEHRRDIWTRHNAHVEIWCEKVGLIGVLLETTSYWDVGLYPCVGQPSKIFLHDAADEIAEIGKPPFIYYLGDFDPSGVCFRDRVNRDLKRYAPKAEIHFEQLAVTPEQIEEYSLPTRPTKQSDPNVRKFKGESVEVDAVPADELRRLVHNAIVQHLDQSIIDSEEKAQDLERETLAEYIRHLPAKAANQ